MEDKALHKKLMDYQKLMESIIGYVDSDDFVEPQMFEKLYKKAVDYDLDIVICGNYNV